MIRPERFDEEFLHIMGEIAHAQGVTRERLMENWCVRRLAEDQAEIRVFEHIRTPLLEMASVDGKPLKGRQLFRWLLRHYTRELEKEYAAELEDSKIKYGIPLTDHEVMILETVEGRLGKYSKPEDAEWTSEVKL